MIGRHDAPTWGLHQDLRLTASNNGINAEQATNGQTNDFEVLETDAWEAESVPQGAETDSSVLIAAQQVFTALVSHVPIDTSATWDDVEAQLPERTSPSARLEGGEQSAKLRLLLLQAIRWGRAPRNAISDQSCNPDGSTNEDREAFLVRVLNDLGALVVEPCDFQDGHEYLEEAAYSNETDEEVSAIDEAIVAIETAASRRHDPLRMFQREFQKIAVLTAEEELKLAQTMETSLRQAIEALCSWPEGINEAIATIVNVRPTSLVSTAGASEDIDNEHESEPVNVPGLDLQMQGDAGELASAEEAIVKYRALPESSSNDVIYKLIATTCAQEPDHEKRSAMKAALAAMHDKPALLLTLKIKGANCEAAKRFVTATSALNSARHKMATANIKWAFHLAKKHMRSGEPLDDLTQEANIGLLKAVDRYDWRRGVRFSTYATWWIRQQVSRYVADKCRSIRLPVHIHEKHQRRLRQALKFEAAQGREPTIEELAEILEMPFRKVAELLKLPAEPIPIDDTEVDAEIAIEYQDDFTAPDPADLAERAELGSSIDSLLTVLSKKELQIIMLRYGLGGLEPLTLDDVGRRFELTRERIRQIESAAIKKLAANGTASKAAKKRGHLRKKQSAPTAEQPGDSGESGRPAIAQPADIGDLLTQAEGLGLLVEDRSDAPGSLLWVKSKEAPDGPIKLIAPWLEEFGFKLWPGEGYWR